MKALHFILNSADAASKPGLWRSGAAVSALPRAGRVSAAGAAAEQVPELIEQLAIAANDPATTEPAPVRAAMAHLALIAIRPFRDGNDRAGRAVHAYLLARDLGGSSGVFAWIDECLGEAAAEANATLSWAASGEAGDGGEAIRLWLRLCLKAQYQQLVRHRARAAEYEQLHDWVAEIVARDGLDGRMAQALLEVALGWPMTNSLYRAGQDMSEFAASRDLRRLHESGLLTASGARRGRSYGPGPELKRLRAASRAQPVVSDPYQLVEGGAVIPAALMPRAPRRRASPVAVGPVAVGPVARQPAPAKAGTKARRASRPAAATPAPEPVAAVVPAPPAAVPEAAPPAVSPTPVMPVAAPADATPQAVGDPPVRKPKRKAREPEPMPDLFAPRLPGF